MSGRPTPVSTQRLGAWSCSHWACWIVAHTPSQKQTLQTLKCAMCQATLVGISLLARLYIEHSSLWSVTA